MRLDNGNAPEKYPGVFLLGEDYWLLVEPKGP
jgi:hypothetical protein